MSVAVQSHEAPVGLAFPEAAAALKAALADELEATNAVVLEHLGSRVPLIPEVASHLISAGGKRLRPLITLAAAKIAGVTGPNPRYLAAAVELIHCATLLHDDVVDESNTRRGFKTANVVFGNKESVLVGDFLFARAFELMVKTGQLPVLDILSGASCTISEGEVLQLATQGNIETTEDMHLDVIKAKTATLFEAAARVGALAVGPSDHAEALATFGLNFGIAYQLVDDALDYGHSTFDIGKDRGDDFRERKMTMPVIMAYEAARDDQERAFWREAFSGKEANFAQAQALIQRDGIGEKALSHAHGYATTAAESLSSLPDHPLKELLVSVAASSAERPF
ncbi:MAG: polyprenyl synthetase family protein [Pseudomonadota bacterium]